MLMYGLVFCVAFLLEVVWILIVEAVEKRARWWAFLWNVVGVYLTYITITCTFQNKEHVHWWALGTGVSSFVVLSLTKGKSHEHSSLAANAWVVAAAPGSDGDGTGEAVQSQRGPGPCENCRLV